MIYRSPIIAALFWAAALIAPQQAFAQSERAADPIAAEQVPEILQPYMSEDGFEPGDHAWWKGAFPEASPADKAEYQQIEDWTKRCAEKGHQAVVLRLQEMGIAKPAIYKQSFYAGECVRYYMAPSVDNFDSFEDFQTALKTTQPIFDAFIGGVNLSASISYPSKGDLAQKLAHRIISEQVVRHAFGWTSSAEVPDEAPLLTKDQKAVFDDLLGRQMIKLDRSNTKWLKTVVEENGWPTQSMVGKSGSGNAWLLAQHADHDPVFQLKILRLMEPLLDQGEVSQGNYAYLYDRVMLKMAGKQKYGTQVTCKDGKWVPLPLENPEKMDEYRAAIGQQTFTEYATVFPACPKD